MLSAFTNLISSCWGGNQEEEEEGEEMTTFTPQAVTMDPVAKEEEVEKMITLYHISNSTKWANGLADAKKQDKKFNELAQPINPTLSSDKRKTAFEKGEAPANGDGRGGDDLGPGFYTGNSAEFVDHYFKNYFDGSANEAQILQFELPEKALEKMKVKDNGTDESTFQQNMADGFASANPKTGKWALPKLDGKPPEQDLAIGPINNPKAEGVTTKQVGDEHFSQGSILKLGSETPLQYNFSSQKGCEELYANSNITSMSPKEWKAMREKQAKGNK